MQIVSSLTPTFGSVVQNQARNSLPCPGDTMTLLAQQGAVLLKGFDFTPESFVNFSGQCCQSFETYAGGALRFRALTRKALNPEGTLLSTTGDGQSFSIPLHGEMYYQLHHPDIIWFYCKTPPLILGQTTVADGHEVLCQLSRRSLDLLRRKRLLYVRELSAQDWPETFQTTSLASLKTLCESAGLMLTVNPDNSIRTEFTCSGLVIDDLRRERFINNLLSVLKFERDISGGLVVSATGQEKPTSPPLVVRLEDGTPVPNWLAEDVERAGEIATVEIQWEQGDVLLLDNRKILHGRRAISGTERQVLVRMGTLANQRRQTKNPSEHCT